MNYHIGVMGARENSAGEEDSNEFSIERSTRRRNLRYRFAELLTIEQFEEALGEALVAYSKDEILRCDLTFVINIVKTAERMGRLKLDPSRIPADLLPPEPSNETAPRPARPVTSQIDRDEKNNYQTDRL